MDAYADRIFLAVKQAPGIYPAASFLERNIVILWYQKLCILAKFL